MALVIGLSGCSLDTEMTGAALTQDQYDKLPSTAEGSVLGLYSMLYRSTSEHHYFGQKSIDMATDILSGDIDRTNQSNSYFLSFGNNDISLDDVRNSTSYSANIGNYVRKDTGTIYNPNANTILLQTGTYNVVGRRAVAGIVGGYWTSEATDNLILTNIQNNTNVSFDAMNNKFINYSGAGGIIGETNRVNRLYFDNCINNATIDAGNAQVSICTMIPFQFFRTGSHAGGLIGYVADTYNQ